MAYTRQINDVQKRIKETENKRYSSHLRFIIGVTSGIAGWAASAPPALYVSDYLKEGTLKELVMFGIFAAGSLAITYGGLKWGENIDNNYKEKFEKDKEAELEDLKEELKTLEEMVD